MTDVVLPGGRDARATLDGADGDRLVVACPPHPRHGGSRSDRRLRAVADALGTRGVDCLRFDYGPWDEGRGERTDARTAVEWGRERYADVALFGYSFGAAVALVAATTVEVRAVAALAPPATVAALDAAAAVPDVDAPGRVVHGTRDATVDSAPVVVAARDRGWQVVAIPADHHFVGQGERVGEAVATFLADPP